MPLLTCNINRDGEKYALQLDLDEAKHAFLLAPLQAGRYYEPDVSLFFLKVARRGDVIIDVGANVGYFSSLAGVITGCSGRVLAFEPDPLNASVLKKNFLLNNIKDAIVIESPAASRIEFREFFTNLDHCGGHALWNPGEFPGNAQSKQECRSRTVQTTTIDEEFSRSGLKWPKIIKIDTEGAEQLILEGSRGLLASRKVPFIVCELHEFGLKRFNHTQRSLR